MNNFNNPYGYPMQGYPVQGYGYQQPIYRPPVQQMTQQPPMISAIPGRVVNTFEDIRPNEVPGGTGFQQIGYELATQGNAIQVAIANQTQALMQNQNDNYRALHDEIVANRMEDMKTENANLRSQIQALNLAQSQANQNTYLVNTLRPCPQPAYVVANPFCCNPQTTTQQFVCPAACGQ